MTAVLTHREPLQSVASVEVEPLVIGRYALFEEIASGGMATVYFGRLIGAAGFARQVAVKRLTGPLASDCAARAMLVDEARLGARIRHPNVVQTLDVVCHRDELLLVMEYVHGETLGRLVKMARARGQHVPVPIALAILTDALQGLHAAHEARTEDDEPLDIVHRDVSPQNIMVGRDGVSRVLDFGIALAAQRRTEETATGLIKGKLAYMSPEQVLGDPVSRQTDVFAVGVVLWELLTGRRLLLGGGENGESLRIDALLKGEFEPPSKYRPTLDPAIDAIVMCALERNPGARFSTASEMARTLEGVSLVATATQVGEWVQDLAGDVLAARGRKLSAFRHADRARSLPEVSSDEVSAWRSRASRVTTPARAGGLARAAVGFALGIACTLGAGWLTLSSKPGKQPERAHVDSPARAVVASAGEHERPSPPVDPARAASPLASGEATVAAPAPVSPHPRTPTAGAAAAPSPRSSAPVDCESLTTLAEARLAAGDAEGAEGLYRRAVAANRWFLPARIGLADLVWTSGRRTEGASSYASIVEEFPADLVPPRARERAASAVAQSRP